MKSDVDDFENSSFNSIIHQNQRVNLMLTD